MKISIATICLSCLQLLAAVSCRTSGGPAADNDGGGNGVVPTTEYSSLYDSPKDEGQYWTPEFKVVPKGYYVCTGKDFGDFGRYEVHKTALLEGLQYANMCESLAGLVNRAVENRKTDYAIWLDGGASKSYALCEKDLQAAGSFKKTEADGIALLKSGLFSDLIKGYVLTDVVGNPESSNVAAVASHVHDAIIVDVRDRQVYEEMGFEMLYDARTKTVADAWKEFRDKCDNKALVVMASHTNDLKDFAIANNLFMMNLYNGEGFNWELLDEVLDWLEPASPIYGCWDNCDEHAFVQPVSEKGHLMVVCNFYMNLSLTSLRYSERQEDLLVNVVNPASIDYSDNDENKYVSYYLSDGDNVQWIFHIWYDGWFKHPMAEKMKMAYGIPSTNLDMIAPSVYRNIVNNQKPENTLVENCAGGYIYIDSYADKKDTDAYLSDLSAKVSASMRQHRMKVLGLFTNDARSDNAKNAYKKFIEANNWLEGVIVVQYVPYNGGFGEVFWYKNSDGVDIPVITVRYTIWDFDRNENGQGTPAYVAHCMKQEQPDFSLVDIHAWSSFSDIGNSDDLLGESLPGNVSGPGAAEMCQRRLPENFKCVSLQELIWRMRMKHNKEQTERIINQYYK